MRIKALLGTLMMSAVVLAGCAADDSTGETQDTRDVPEVPEVPAATAVHRVSGNVTAPDLPIPAGLVPVGTGRYIGTSTFEPSIGADADGCLYMTSYRGTGTGTRIYKSCDQAESWADIGPNLIADGPQGDEPCFRNSNDPFVHVDMDTGRVFSSDLHALVTSTLHYTDDQGDSWTCNVLGGGVPPGVHDHQSITTGTPRTVPTVGYDNVVYYCVNRVSDSWCSASYDGGLGFGPAVTVFAGVANRGPVGGDPLESFCGGLTGHVETDNAGRVFFPKNQCGQAQVGVSEDDGLMWTTHVIDATVGVQAHEVRIAADDADNVYAFWIGADDLPYLSISRDHGVTWEGPHQVGPPDLTAAGRPAIAAGAEGNVVVAYIGMTVEGGRQDPAQEMAWYAYMGVLYDAHEGDPTVFTVKAKEDPIDIGRDCASARCGGIGDFIDATVDRDGRPWAAFGDQCTEGCEDGLDGNVGFVGTLDTGKSMLGDAALLPLDTVAVPANATADP